MYITIKPQKFTGSLKWYSKLSSVIFVEKKEDIEPLWKLLCEQDEYWEQYKKIIKVAPKEINNEYDLNKYCEYCGKTDIYEIDKLKKKVPFIIHQIEPDTNYYSLPPNTEI